MRAANDCLSRGKPTEHDTLERRTTREESRRSDGGDERFIVHDDPYVYVYRVSIIKLYPRRGLSALFGEKF